MKYIFTVVLLIFFGLASKSQCIIDDGSFFTDSEKSALIDKMYNIEERSTVQILVYTKTELGSQSALELARKYSPGSDVNNRVVIFLSKNDRRLQILVGYGLEWEISDRKSQLIVDQMIPFFKRNEFHNGVSKALDLIDEKVIHSDWEANKMKRLSENENGRIFKMQYSNKTGSTRYKYAIDTDEQFSEDFRIKFMIDNEAYNLYYSKYMNDLISKILTSKSISVSFRLKDFKEKRLELIGIY